MIDTSTMPGDAGDDAVRARADAERVVSVRAWLQEHAPGPPMRDVLGRITYQLYVVAVFSGLWGAAVASTLSRPPASSFVLPPDARVVIPAATLGLAVLLSLTGIRIGTWAGPVLVSRPEAAWMLPAPLDRRLLLRRNLGVGLAVFGVAGAVIGLLLGVVVAVEARTAVAVTVVGSTVAWGGLGVATGAIALLVESSRRMARVALRATPLLIAVGAGLVWLGAVRPVVAGWATPWGWAVAPAMTGLGLPVSPSWLPPVLAVVLAIVAVVVAVRHLPALPDEELVRRAGTATGVRASAAMFDARAIAQARRSGQQSVVGVRRVRVRRPRSRVLLVAWRDLVSLLRRRGLPERTLAVVAGAGGLVAWASGGVAAIIGAVLLCSLAAGQLLEPLRIELEDPIIDDLTAFTALDVALEHLVVPFLSLVVAGALATGLFGILGVVAWASVPAALVGVVALAALFTGVAGLTSTRGAPPLQWLLSGEAGVGLLLGWVLAGPLLALVLAVPLVLGAASGLQAGDPAMSAVTTPAFLAVSSTAVLVALTRWRIQRRTED